MSTSNLGVRRTSPLLADLTATAWKLYGSPKTANVLYVDGPNYCAMGAAATSTDSFAVVPGNSARLNDVTRELFYAIPRETRDELVASMVARFGFNQPALREDVVVQYNDRLTKAQCTEWAFAAVKRVRERYA